MDIAHPPSRNPPERSRNYLRAYKACLSCRHKKARCDVGNAGPPCARCRREQRQCVFSERRSRTRNTAVDESSIAPPERRVIQNGLSGSGHSVLDPPNQAGASYASSPDTLRSSMMRTVVSSGNDALNLLFEAASQANTSTGRLHTSANARADQSDLLDQGPHVSAATTIGTSPAAPPAIELSNSNTDLLKVWGTCRFVKIGWFTPSEAVTFVDKFFENLSPLSPILTDFYSKHENHHLLITREPFLCCTILMISSRYHVLPGIGGASRSFFIHHRLWQHCQSLIMRLMLGQERSSNCSARTVGTIEALLLISEWHPRSLHFPPESDGWDSDMAVGADANLAPDQSTPTNQWLQDVIEPARRSDRMSWMLLGSAFSLAHELAVFEPDDQEAETSPNDNDPLSELNKLRKQRVQLLLYVYINQLSARIGCKSLMPQHPSRVVAGGSASITDRPEWIAFMNAWIELTLLAKSVSDMLSPSVLIAKEQLRSGRYVGLLDHFRPLLDQWKSRHLDLTSLGSNFYNILCIEYQYVRVFTHSFGLQAVVERALADSTMDGEADEMGPVNIDNIDYEFIQEVIDGSCQILEKVIELARTDQLRFSPVRIFLRVTASSIFLLKALSLGVRQAKLQESLDVLERGVQALRSNILDDVHLASRYAMLLEVHISRLRRNLIASAKAPGLSAGFSTRTSSAPPRNRNGDRPERLSDNTSTPTDNVNFDADGDWLFSLPFDPSMAPFRPNGGQLSAFDEGTLDFLWNLPG